MKPREEITSRAKVRPGDYIKLTSSDWWIWDGKKFRRMTVDEQLEVSK